MRVLLTVVIVIFLLALPPLVPTWTPAAAVVMVLLATLCLSGLAALWLSRRAEAALRVGAAVVALIFVLAAADQLVAAIATRTPIVGGSTPIVGLIVIGFPAAFFAARGWKHRPDGEIAEHEGVELDNLEEKDGDEAVHSDRHA